MGVCNCSMFCCMLLYVHSSIAIILIGKRELIALLNLSSWCLVMVERLFLAVPRGCLQFVIVVFPDHTHLLFFIHLCEVLQTVEETTNNNNNNNNNKLSITGRRHRVNSSLGQFARTTHPILIYTGHVIYIDRDYHAD